MKGHGRLVLMSPEQAAYELKSDKLKPLDAGKVANAAMVSTAEAHPGAVNATPAAQPTPKVIQVSNPEPTGENQQ
jgi:hypothetical protein